MGDTVSAYGRPGAGNLNEEHYMFRKLTILLSLVLTLGFAIGSSAAAQDVPDPDIPDLEGIESGYIRM